MSTQIKTRFAPSPTGDLHIGGLRTALFAYLFAKKNQGQFFLRVEDTDQTRYKEGSLNSILEGLKWAGLHYDGDLVYQSKRTAIYQKYAAELVKAGHAYHCFCTADDLATMRQEQTADGNTVTRYDRRCLNLTPEEVKAKLDAGTPHVIRLKVPSGETEFTDLIRGKVKINNADVDDQILLKSDGFPTYHLANVIDDHDMGISHVIRAEEWLPSTPKHIILYQMFDWDIPEFAHLSMVLAPDRSKLSKRHGATSVLEFKNLGYLPEAVVNYIALLGWNPGTEQEVFSLSELEKEFDLAKVNKSGAIFDIEKLNWLNGHYIRQKTIQELAELCLPYLQADENIKIQEYKNNYIELVVGLEQERLKKLSEIGERTKYFFARPTVDPQMMVWKKSTPEETQERLKFLLEFLATVPEENWTRNTLQDIVIEEIGRRGYGNGDTLWPMRVALSGEEKSPSPFEIAEVLGKSETIERLKMIIEKA
ncbi:glutamate--tRNA ligase [Candidatus Kuenenbacteria bacterium]|nr:glutamate--tRNA ligase [Candidatus Kuenenbacteria bacterium]